MSALTPDPLCAVLGPAARDVEQYGHLVCRFPETGDAALLDTDACFPVALLGVDALESVHRHEVARVDVDAAV